MIGSLTGAVGSRDGNVAIVDVQGVGYEVIATNRSLDAWVSSDGPVTIIVSTQVREDAITLYGFESVAERRAFRVLIGVNKVGAKLAMAALDSLGLAALVQAVESEDVTALCRISGVGKRTAQRLAMELKGKLPAGDFGPVASAPAMSSGPDAFSMALQRLGWSKMEIEAARVRVAEAGLGEDAPVGQRVRIALQSSLRK